MKLIEIRNVVSEWYLNTNDKVVAVVDEKSIYVNPDYITCIETLDDDEYAAVYIRDLSFVVKFDDLQTALLDEGVIF